VSDPIDYRDLLVRYMALVGQTEGTVCVHAKDATGLLFNAAEMVELFAIEHESRAIEDGLVPQLEAMRIEANEAHNRRRLALLAQKP